MPAPHALLAFLTDPANLAGALAVCCSFTWPQLLRLKAILAVQAMGSLLFCLHYVMLGASTAAAMCAAGASQGVIAALIARRRLRQGLYAAAVLGGVALTLATWSGLPSLLAQSGQLASAFGRLQRDLQRLRLFFLCSTCIWVSHNLLMGSVWGLASDTLTLTGLLAGLWRNRRAGTGPAVPALEPARAS
jgi:hypothetical protein